MKIRNLAPVIALAALASAQAAQAQQQACVNPGDLSDAIVYAMPLAYDAAQTACANRFEADGFMATRGETYIAQFRASQNEAWPGAFRFLKTFMNKDGGSDDQMAAMLATMPEDTLRPFVDALVGQMLAKEIKGDSCGKIERGVELLSPLPVDNVGGLIGFIAEMTDLKNPPICGTAPATSGK